MNFKNLDIENSNKTKKLSIFAGIAAIKAFYPSPNEDDYLDTALNCLRLIGNLHHSIYQQDFTSDKDGIIELPYCALQIESVTFPTYDRITQSINNEQSNLYGQGGYVKYVSKGDSIVVAPNLLVTIIYKSYEKDENDLPLITEAEAEALGYYWIYIDISRKVYEGNQLAFNQIALATKNKNLKILQARVQGKMNQNFMDQFANINFSSDRKSYGYSSKPIKIN